ncbi:MAG: hypothetical protein WBW31_12645 [Candidatus Sulfotelmatobacter sp.]
MGEYCRIERTNREQLASELGCSADVLEWLSLCRRPSSERFASDISRIAERFQVKASKLGEVVRRVDAVAAIRGGSHLPLDGESFLLAARDRDEEKDT